MINQKMVYTEIVLDWITGEIIFRKGYPFSGHWAGLKGPTAAQNQIASSQQSFFSQLTSSFNQMFAGQTGILQSLQQAFQPILAAGPNQFGFSPQEMATLKAGAVNQTAQTFAANQQALNNALAARGGGNAFLPSGAQAQLQQQGYTAASQEESGLLNQITQAGYAQGRQNFLTAANVLGSTAAMYNPTGYAGQATQAGEQAFGTATQIAKEQAAASPWGAIGGALGGIAGTLLGGPMGGQIGEQLGSALGGSGSASSFNFDPNAAWGGAIGGGGGGGDNLSWADVSAGGAVVPGGAALGANYQPGAAPNLSMPTTNLPALPF
jgi:hypothetical protein